MFSSERFKQVITVYARPSPLIPSFAKFSHKIELNKMLRELHLNALSTSHTLTHPRQKARFLVEGNHSKNCENTSEIH